MTDTIEQVIERLSDNAKVSGFTVDVGIHDLRALLDHIKMLEAEIINLREHHEGY